MFNSYVSLPEGSDGRTITTIFSACSREISRESIYREDVLFFGGGGPDQQIHSLNGSEFINGADVTPESCNFTAKH